jgi:tRNA(Met) C34 N-acetyltransferase TmcA
MGDGLKRAFAAAKATREGPIVAALRVAVEGLLNASQVDRKTLNQLRFRGWIQPATIHGDDVWVATNAGRLAHKRGQALAGSTS